MTRLNWFRLELWIRNVDLIAVYKSNLRSYCKSEVMDLHCRYLLSFILIKPMTSFLVRVLVQGCTHYYIGMGEVTSLFHCTTGNTWNLICIAVQEIYLNTLFCYYLNVRWTFEYWQCFVLLHFIDLYHACFYSYTILSIMRIRICLPVHSIPLTFHIG